MTLRAATPADYEAVIGLLERAGLPLAGIPAEMDDFIVADEEGRLVGVVGLERYGDSALLRSAVVEPGLRGTGVGASLVEGVLGRARERGTRDVYLLTTTAERWFPRFGFVRVERDAVPVEVRTSVEFREACPASAAVMRKSLTP
jgi:amino-acid N-acetyltransferase